MLKKNKTEGSSLNLNKDRSGGKGTERTQENINTLQEKLIEDLLDTLYMQSIFY